MHWLKHEEYEISINQSISDYNLISAGPINNVLVWGTIFWSRPCVIFYELSSIENKKKRFWHLDLNGMVYDVIDPLAEGQ